MLCLSLWFSLFSIWFCQTTPGCPAVLAFHLFPGFYAQFSWFFLKINLLVINIFVFLRKHPQILPWISKRRAKFCSNYLRTIENASQLVAMNFKPLRILKCHKFQIATNVPFYFYFCPTFSFPCFILVFLIFEVLLFPYFFTKPCWAAWRKVRSSSYVACQTLSQFPLLSFPNFASAIQFFVDNFSHVPTLVKSSFSLEKKKCYFKAQNLLIPFWWR